MAVNANFLEYNPQVTEQSTAHLVMGQPTPNVIANVMGGTDGTGQFLTLDAATYTMLQEILQSQQTIFISNPYGDDGVNYVRFGPQTGALSTGSGNTVKSARLLPSTAAGPYRTIDVTWTAAVQPPV